MSKYAIVLNALKNNRGSEALLRGMIQMIQEQDKDADFAVISSEPDIGTINYVAGVNQYICKYQYHDKKSFFYILLRISEKIFGFNRFARGLRYGHLKEKLCKVDKVLIVAADNYDHSYHLVSQMHQLHLYLKENIRAELWLYDCSIETRDITPEVKDDMGLFDVITVRESESMKAVQTALSGKKICFFPDPAFAMKPEKYDLPFLDKKAIVGINLSNLIMSPKYGGDIDCIYKNYYCLIDEILQQNDYEICLFPHVMGNADLSVLRTIKEHYMYEKRIHLVEDERITAPQLKYIISKFRFLITARTHASIAAYSSMIPTLVLGYSVKSKGIAIDLFGQTEHFVIDVQHLCDNEQLKDEFLWLQEHEWEIKNILSNTMAAYQRNALEFARMLTG